MGHIIWLNLRHLKTLTHSSLVATGTRLLNGRTAPKGAQCSPARSSLRLQHQRCQASLNYAGFSAAAHARKASPPDTWRARQHVTIRQLLRPVSLTAAWPCRSRTAPRSRQRTVGQERVEARQGRVSRLRLEAPASNVCGHGRKHGRATAEPCPPFKHPTEAFWADRISIRTLTCTDGMPKPLSRACSKGRWAEVRYAEKLPSGQLSAVCGSHHCKPGGNKKRSSSARSGGDHGSGSTKGSRCSSPPHAWRCSFAHSPLCQTCRCRPPPWSPHSPSTPGRLLPSRQRQAGLARGSRWAVATDSSSWAVATNCRSQQSMLS